jgi:hypothetical protein
MEQVRYLANLIDREDYQYLIGVFNDDSGCSVKIFINDNNSAEKIIFFDDQVVSVEKFITKVDFKNLINWELNSKLEIKNLLDKLIPEGKQPLALLR